MRKMAVKKKSEEIPEEVTLTKNFTLKDILKHWAHNI